MSEFFHESALGSLELGGSTTEEARRAYALDLAVRIHCSRANGRPLVGSHAWADTEVVETAGRFAEYIRGGEGD